MADLIERHIAIDAIKTWGLIDGLSEGQAIEILSDENKVPSAEPEAISRWKKEFKEYVDSLDIARDDWKGIIEYIYELPLVQPDTTTHDSIPAKTGKNDGDGTSGDCISRQAAIDKFIDDLEEIFSDIREREVDDSVCGLCEYDGAYIGQSGDWCNECPGFDRDDCFKLSDKTRKKWTDEIIKAFPSVQPEHIKGHWIAITSWNNTYKCSVCGRLLVNITDGKNKVAKNYPYCHCGADMRGDKHETD